MRNWAWWASNRMCHMSFNQTAFHLYLLYVYAYEAYNHIQRLNFRFSILIFTHFRFDIFHHSYSIPFHYHFSGNGKKHSLIVACHTFFFLFLFFFQLSSSTINIFRSFDSYSFGNVSCQFNLSVRLTLFLHRFQSSAISISLLFFARVVFYSIPFDGVYNFISLFRLQRKLAKPNYNTSWLLPWNKCEIC